MRTVLLAASVGIASFLTGLWVGSRVSAQPASMSVGNVASPVAVVAQQTDPAVLHAIEDLRAEIRALRRRLDAEPPASEQRTAATAPSAEAVDLVARLRELVVDVSPADPRAARAAPLRSVRDLAKSAGFATRDALFQDLDSVLPAHVADGTDEAKAAWAATLKTNSKRWENAHLTWTLDEVEAQYGRPEEVRADGEGPSYVYNNAGRDGLTGSFVFQSRKGYIYDVDVYVK